MGVDSFWAGAIWTLICVLIGTMIGAVVAFYWLGGEDEDDDERPGEPEPDLDPYPWDALDEFDRETASMS